MLAVKEALGTDLEMGAYAPNPSGQWFEKTTPGHRVAVITRYEGEEHGKPVLTQMRWGYPGINHSVYNARLETIETRDMWYRDFEHRRCIMPIKSFVEGRTRFTNAEDGPLFCAAIFTHGSRATDDTGNWRDVALITVAARGVVMGHHDRQPAVIPNELLDKWLDRTHNFREDRLALSIYEPKLTVAGVA